MNIYLIICISIILVFICYYLINKLINKLIIDLPLKRGFKYGPGLFICNGKLCFLQSSDEYCKP